AAEQRRCWRRRLRVARGRRVARLPGLLPGRRGIAGGRLARRVARLGLAALVASLHLRLATLDLLAATTAPALARRTLAFGRERSGVHLRRWRGGRRTVASGGCCGRHGVARHPGFACGRHGPRLARTLFPLRPGIAPPTGAQAAAAAPAAALLRGGPLLPA